MESTQVRKPGNKLVNYFRESKEELQKVVWPTRRETFNYTLLVIGLSVGIALFLALVDYVLTLGVEKIIK